MRTITRIVAPFASTVVLGIVAACNTSTGGEEGQLSFTPVRCGNPLLGCDVADGLAVGGITDIEVRATGAPTVEGLTLVSTTPDLIEVVDIVDPGGVATWGLRGVAAGSATLSARDPGGVEIDRLRITVARPDRLALVNLVGDATGPSDEQGVDEAWTVPAGQLVSFQAVPMQGETRLMGRFGYAFSILAEDVALLDTEQSTSDVESGYLYVQPAAGDYLFDFSINTGLTVYVALHAR